MAKCNNISINLKAISFDHERESERYQNACSNAWQRALLHICFVRKASKQPTITASVYTKHTRIQTRWPPTLLHPIGLKKKAESPFLVQCTFKTETKRSRVIDVSNVKRIRKIQVFVRLSCFCAIQPFSLVSVL